jgi:hypothetical protein
MVKNGVFRGFTMKNGVNSIVFHGLDTRGNAKKWSYRTFFSKTISIVINSV